MAKTVELPALVKVDMAEESFRKAVQQNFDHLAQALKVTLDSVETAAQDTGLIVETIRATETDGEDTDLRAILEAEGVGSPDGNAPTVAPTGLTGVSGINYDVWLSWNAVQNTSPLSYRVERKLGAGGAWAEVGVTTRVPGSPSGIWQYHDTGLVLGNSYYYRVRAEDDDGLGPYSAEAGPFQVNRTVAEQIADLAITSTKIADNAISTPKLQANAVLAGNIAAGQIVTDHMVANTIQGDRIVTGTLNADKIVAGSITATQIQTGAITADKVDANAITGKNVRSGSAGGFRMEFSASSHAVEWHTAGGQVGTIFVNSGGLMVIDSNGQIAINSQVNFSDWILPLVYRFDGGQISTAPSIAQGTASVVPGTGGTAAESKPKRWFRVADSGGTGYWVPAY